MIRSTTPGEALCDCVNSSRASDRPSTAPALPPPGRRSRTSNSVLTRLTLVRICSDDLGQCVAQAGRSGVLGGDVVLAEAELERSRIHQSEPARSGVVSARRRLHTVNQARSDLARLRLNVLIARRPGANTYGLTPDGPRVAIFYTKVQDRLLRPLIAADSPPAPLDYGEHWPPSTGTSPNTPITRDWEALP